VLAARASHMTRARHRQRSRRRGGGAPRAVPPPPARASTYHVVRRAAQRCKSRPSPLLRACGQRCHAVRCPRKCARVRCMHAVTSACRLMCGRRRSSITTKAALSPPSRITTRQLTTRKATKLRKRTPPSPIKILGVVPSSPAPAKLSLLKKSGTSACTPVFGVGPWKN